jgi:hypothetical protein
MASRSVLHMSFRRSLRRTSIMDARISFISFSERSAPSCAAFSALALASRAAAALARWAAISRRSSSAASWSEVTAASACARPARSASIHSWSGPSGWPSARQQASRRPWACSAARDTARSSCRAVRACSSATLDCSSAGNGSGLGRCRAPAGGDRLCFCGCDALLRGADLGLGSGDTPLGGVGPLLGLHRPCIRGAGVLGRDACTLSRLLGLRLRHLDLRRQAISLGADGAAPWGAVGTAPTRPRLRARMHRPHRQRLTAVAREQCLEVHAALIAARLPISTTTSQHANQHIIRYLRRQLKRRALAMRRASDPRGQRQAITHGRVRAPGSAIVLGAAAHL